VRTFTITARGQLAIDGRKAAPLRAEQSMQEIETAMANYVARADAVADRLSSGAGDEAARELRAAARRRAVHLCARRQLDAGDRPQARGRGARPARAGRAPRDRGSIGAREPRPGPELRGVATVTRGLVGSTGDRREWVRTAEEKRQLLANETERVEAERETVQSSIAQAELLVRAAERNEGKTAIHAPISGTLSETQLAELDGIGPNASVGVIEDTDQLVLKVRVLEPDWPLVAEGQAVSADIAGRTVTGTVAWKVPRAGQEVRDQEWNLLVRVDSDVTGIEAGAKAEGAVIVGRRSFLRRLLDRQQGRQYASSVAGTRLALVDDPTEQRSSADVGDLAASDAVGRRGAPGLAEAAGSN
jgi:hypothetical protein